MERKLGSGSSSTAILTWMPKPPLLYRQANQERMPRWPRRVPLRPFLQPLRTLPIRSSVALQTALDPSTSFKPPPLPLPLVLLYQHDLWIPRLRRSCARRSVKRRRGPSMKRGRGGRRRVHELSFGSVRRSLSGKVSRSSSGRPPLRLWLEVTSHRRWTRERMFCGRNRQTSRRLWGCRMQTGGVRSNPRLRPRPSSNRIRNISNIPSRTSIPSRLSSSISAPISTNSRTTFIATRLGGGMRTTTTACRPLTCTASLGSLLSPEARSTPIRVQEGIACPCQEAASVGALSDLIHPLAVRVGLIGRHPSQTYVQGLHLPRTVVDSALAPGRRRVWSNLSSRSLTSLASTRMAGDPLGVIPTGQQQVPSQALVRCMQEWVSRWFPHPCRCFRLLALAILEALKLQTASCLPTSTGHKRVLEDDILPHHFWECRPCLQSAPYILRQIRRHMNSLTSIQAVLVPATVRRTIRGHRSLINRSIWLSRAPAIQMDKLYPPSVISRRGPISIIKRPRADCSLGSTLEAFFGNFPLASFFVLTFPLLLATRAATFVSTRSVFSLFTLVDNPPLFSSFLPASSHVLVLWTFYFRIYDSFGLEWTTMPRTHPSAPFSPFLDV